MKKVRKSLRCMQKLIYTIVGTSSGIWIVHLEEFELIDFEKHAGVVCSFCEANGFSIKSMDFQFPPCFFQWAKVPFVRNNIVHVNERHNLLNRSTREYRYRGLRRTVPNHNLAAFGKDRTDTTNIFIVESFNAHKRYISFEVKESWP